MLIGTIFLFNGLNSLTAILEHIDTPTYLSHKIIFQAIPVPTLALLAQQHPQHVAPLPGISG